MSGLLEQLEQTARDEAICLQHPYIRSEHLLQTLVKQDASVLSISYEALFARLSELPSPLLRRILSEIKERDHATSD